MPGHRIPRALRRCATAVALAAVLAGAVTVRAQDRAQDRVRVAMGEVPPDDVLLQRPDASADATPDSSAEPAADGGLLEVSALTGERPLVLLFWSTRCPVCERYAATVRRLSEDIGSVADIRLVVNGAAADDDGVKAALERQELTLPVLRDPQGAAARLAVRVTPTAVVLDAEGAVRYRGPLDDDRRARGRDARALLLPAVRALVAGQEVESAEARAFGSALR